MEAVSEEAVQLKEVGQMSKATSKVFGFVGKTAGVYDAYNAITEAYDNPTAGNITKAVFKTAMVFIKTNPVISIVLGALDVSGITDSLFNW